MGRASKELMEAYESIVKKKDKFGTFHKVVFHMHSPASYDYRVCDIYGTEGYRKCSAEDALEMCEKYHVFPKGSFLLSYFETSEEFKMYSEAKEALIYLLMAQKILDARIEMVVLTDHNTIAGFKKLKYAIQLLKKVKQGGIYPTIVLGVELSCADKNHVVGIFDDKEENRLRQWLDEYIMSEQDGTYLTSYDVMQQISNMGGISYIGHIDTSDTFSEKYLSGAYKKKLFQTDSFHIVGISNIEKTETIRGCLKNYTAKDVGFIWDEDAHTIQEIGTKCMWMKGSKLNFQTIRNAIRDYGISIEYEKPQHIHSYIRGIYMKGTGDNFLSGKNNEDFCLTFSDSLNCIIGGRGTGKSTIIRLIDFVIRQHCAKENELEFICRHRDIWLLYIYGEEEYMIHFLAPVKRYGDEQILRYFTDNRNHGYTYRYHFYKYDVEDYALRHYIEIEKLERREGVMFTQKVAGKKKCLERFFHAGYSVDELVKTAGSEALNQFIYGMLFQNQILKGACNTIKVRSRSGLQKALHQTQSLLDQRREKVETVVYDFNSRQKDLLQIVYSQNQPVEEFPYEVVFRRKYGKSRYYCQYNILLSSVADYLHRMQEEMGILKLLQMLFDEKYDEMEMRIPISEFKEELTEDMVIGGIGEVDDQALLRAIQKDLLEEGNIQDIIEYLQKYVTEIESFDLKFNLNSKEDSRTLPPMFRSVANLSMGQKVVAMLSFVLGYSEYAGDCTPFIIDQPEDNLDNQYIYKNLVAQLKKIKQTRQVIIATHNATIVTNAKAEQVIVMESDDHKGWVEATGYPNEKRIKKYIVNQLEGGVESFKHKCFVYEEVLK